MNLSKNQGLNRDGNFSMLLFDIIDIKRTDIIYIGSIGIPGTIYPALIESVKSQTR